jgi:hypothetical protein
MHTTKGEHMKEEWLMSGAVVPVDVETTAALVAEIRRLIDVVGGMALAQPVQVTHTVIAGALFDFMGYLTSRRERIVLSASDDAAPAVDAIRDFATKRGLSLDDAQVREWIEALAQPDAFEQGRQQGMKQERALWTLTKVGQEKNT